MYMDDLTLVVACVVKEQKLPFYLDTGASGTNLFAAYYNRFAGDSGNWTKRKIGVFGAGGTLQREVFVQPTLHLGVGEQVAVLKDVKIYTPNAESPADYIYGNLGQDLFASFSSFTLDFNTMHFSLGSSRATSLHLP
jgi:hypothetical protein